MTGVDAGEQVIEIAKHHSQSIRGVHPPSYVCSSIGMRSERMKLKNRDYKSKRGNKS